MKSTIVVLVNHTSEEDLTAEVRLAGDGEAPRFQLCLDLLTVAVKVTKIAVQLGLKKR